VGFLVIWWIEMVLYYLSFLFKMGCLIIFIYHGLPYFMQILFPLFWVNYTVDKNTVDAHYKLDFKLCFKFNFVLNILSFISVNILIVYIFFGLKLDLIFEISYVVFLVYLFHYFFFKLPLQIYIAFFMNPVTYNPILFTCIKCMGGLCLFGIAGSTLYDNHYLGVTNIGNIFNSIHGKPKFSSSLDWILYSERCLYLGTHDLDHELFVDKSGFFNRGAFINLSEHESYNAFFKNLPSETQVGFKQLANVQYVYQNGLLIKHEHEVVIKPRLW